MVIKWGICGAGHIGADFKIGLDVHPDKHQVLAVASRSLEKARAFAQKHQIERAYGSYEDLANDNDVDIVQVGVVTSHHYSVSKLFIEAGKNVLCEIPCSMYPGQVKELTKLAKEKGVFFMENLWTMVAPAFQKAKEMIDKGDLGDCTLLSGTFCINSNPIAHEVPRLFSAELGGGGWAELGTFMLMGGDIAYNQKEPDDMKVFAKMNPSGGVDENFACVLDYGNGKLAQFTTSVSVELPTSLDIAGTKGWIRFNHPAWIPQSFTSSAGDFSHPHPKSTSDIKEYYPFATAFAYTAEEVRQCLEAGKTESDIITHALSIRLANGIHRGLSLIGYLK